MGTDDIEFVAGSQSWVARTPSDLTERRAIHQEMAALIAGHAQHEAYVEDDYGNLTDEGIIWRIEMPTVEEAIWDDRGRLHAIIVIEGDRHNPQGMRAEYPFYMTLTYFYGPFKSLRLDPPDRKQIEWDMPANPYSQFEQKDYQIKPKKGYMPNISVELARLDNYVY